ncbi:PaaI family thioesterase [Sulfobacillus harzensis]|uniref:PaaI family thioesterase n=1 Tax=Sulfobacillus harzensis TaxID=2729629 RepID=A0A7Y0Q2F4_9FIRM|nr:PaaI family thioesterase [Sulfobacillus harzensis]NMP22280.1 PaaI family thioesterase [Sulfobacillus harzensis]
MASFDWDNNVCFVCGSDVPGLHLKFSGDSQEVRASAVINPPYQGFEGVVHGGILAGIVDDAMWHVIHQHDETLYPMTAELKVRYHAPARIGERLTVVGHLISFRRRLMVAEAVIEDADGGRLVSAEGRFMPPADA